MKILLFLTVFGWLVPADLNFSHRLFVKEIESQFSASEGELLDITSALAGDSELQGRYYQVGTGQPVGFAYVGRVNTCRSGGCSGDQNSSQLASEFFDYFILFDRSGKVLQVRVFNYQATHGHGITSRGWLRQFNGYNGSKKLEPGKNIDAISGATISVRSITFDVEEKSRRVRQNLAMLP